MARDLAVAVWQVFAANFSQTMSDFKMKFSYVSANVMASTWVQACKKASGPEKN